MIKNIRHCICLTGKAIACIDHWIIPQIKDMKKREIYSLSILIAFNLAIREARERLGLNDGPIPVEERYKGELINGQAARDKSDTLHLEFVLKMDSIYNSSPGRSSRLTEFYASRARKELQHVRDKDEELVNK